MKTRTITLIILALAVIAVAVIAISKEREDRQLPPPDGQALYLPEEVIYHSYAETDKVMVPAPEDPWARTLSFNETVPNVNDGGPQSFTRYDERGVECYYGNTWRGGPEDQYIYLLYCADDPALQ